MEQLERALAQRESADASRIAHTFKGTAGVFGAVMMESLAAEIEQAARRASFAAAVAGCPPLRAEIDRVMATLAGWRL
jgi:HPt (histidine-containing phosphotransfer) domain-containing protein